ncbi:hypothetical protein IVB12_15215 [Bradyrhizobium sp. 179]|uniref:hypothetical protein n=1 Tax=Bradyrhizobium sp. 179 TaxID=2782648 RepID=UPI001FF78F69|nr:hypothetical protein [Bradyrhizobium sp. 179]MCK1543264.1 hypothetical protein [Bradyrhizobium sp. 179]
MTMARYDQTVQDTAGNVIAGATVEVRSEIPGQPLAALYTDRDGTISAGNPLTTDSNGEFGFYCPGGFYKIVVTSGVLTKTRRYVGIGLAQGTDTGPVGGVQRKVTAAGDVTITNDDADVIVIAKTVGAATAVLLPDPSTATKPFRIVDGKYDAATNNITVTSAGTAKKIMGGAAYIIDSNGASITLTPLADGTGWV